MKIRIKKSISIDYDNVLTTFIGCYFLIQAINLFIKTAIYEPSWWQIFSKALLGVLLGFALLVIIKRNISILITEIIMGILLVFPIVMNTFSYDYVGLNDTLFDFFFVYLPLGLMVYTINDMNKALQRLVKYSRAAVVVLYLTIFISNIKGFFISSNLENNSYNMALGYALLFHSLILMDNFFETRKKANLIVAIISVVLIILFASRSPLLCLLFYFFVRMFKADSVSKKTKLKIIGGLIIFALALFVFYMFFAESLYYELKDAGYESTALRKLLLNPLDDSNRLNIYKSYLEHAIKRPIFGYGILGGWYLGTYPHNIFIEIILSFGFIGGTIFIIWGVILISQGLRCKYKPLQRIISILLAYNVHLLLSASFLTSITFCMLIAACVKSQKIDKDLVGILKTNFCTLEI